MSNNTFSFGRRVSNQLISLASREGIRPGVEGIGMLGFQSINFPSE